MSDPKSTNQKPTPSQEELLQKIYESTEKTRKYIRGLKILSIIKLIIIIIPIILAIIYLPPLLKQALEPYQELLQFNSSASQGINLQGVDINELIKMYK